MHVVDRNLSLLDFEPEHELVERRTPGAEIAVAREWPALEAAQQLLDIDAGERTVMGIQACGAAERVGHRQHGRSRPFDIERDVAAALEPANSEYLAEAALEIDVDECDVRGHGDPAIGVGEPERALGDAAERLRIRRW